MTTLNYGMLHYHCRPGGVRTVMENTAVSLFKYGKFKEKNISFIGDVLSNQKYVGTFEIPGYNVVNIDINELNYSFSGNKTENQLIKQANKLKERLIHTIPLENCSKENPYYLHVHNTNLGKSPIVTAALYQLAEWAINKPIVMIIQIHDFAENGRYELLKNMQNCIGKFDKEFAAKIMYPNQKSVVYATINPGDMQNLLSVGIDEDRIFLLPNSVDTKSFEQKSLDEMNQKELKDLGLKKANFSGEIKKRIKKFASFRKFNFNQNRSIILAPLKSMRRKNIMESILFTLLLNEEHKETHQLIVSLDAASGEDKKYSNKVKKFVKKHNLPVVIGIGKRIIAPVAERIIDQGYVKFFNMDDLFELSEAIITTSLVEGFGFVYHEGWLTNKFVFGRKIPYVTNAYEENKMNFNHMYTKLNLKPEWINLDRVKKKYFKKINSLRRKQEYKTLTKEEFEIEFKQKKLKGGFVDFGDLDIVSQKIFVENFNKYKKELIKINPHINFSVNIDNRIIKKNKENSKKNYSLQAKAKRLQEIFKESKKLIQKNTLNKKVDNTKVIEKYMDLENIRLLI